RRLAPPLSPHHRSSNPASAVPTCLSKSSFVLNRTNRLFVPSTAAGQMNRFVRLLITAISRKRSLARLANLVGTALGRCKRDCRKLAHNRWNLRVIRFVQNGLGCIRSHLSGTCFSSIEGG